LCRPQEELRISVDITIVNQLRIGSVAVVFQVPARLQLLDSLLYCLSIWPVTHRRTPIIYPGVPKSKVPGALPEMDHGIVSVSVTGPFPLTLTSNLFVVPSAVTRIS